MYSGRRLSVRLRRAEALLVMPGTQTQGVVLCNQPRILDLRARKARFVESAPIFIVDEVLAKLSTLID